ncbi:hypothetical protein GWI33_004316 [Rhynchophorus ferrugineus]|uniref:Uncharacterized protein n=1 Tax=Rhynchophorus ferrugineus TaxID=354439 RepID=A0A834MGW1_RHYFE|nr:hypothetical protein GWI33_004316 [Rhynchophorus ferrugineus]
MNLFTDLAERYRNDLFPIFHRKPRADRDQKAAAVPIIIVECSMEREFKPIIIRPQPVRSTTDERSRPPWPPMPFKYRCQANEVAMSLLPPNNRALSSIKRQWRDSSIF